MKKSFTLLEVMTVVAILAILFSMLLPNLSKARDKAKTVSCMNNQNQLSRMAYGVTVSGYDADGDHNFIESSHQTESAPRTYVNVRWMEPIAESSSMEYTGSNWGAKIARRPELTCPEREQLPQTTIHKAHYGINPWINRYPSHWYFQNNYKKGDTDAGDTVDDDGYLVDGNGDRVLNGRGTSANGILNKILYKGNNSNAMDSTTMYWSTVKAGMIQNPSFVVYFTDTKSDDSWESECWNAWGSSEKHHDAKKKTVFVAVDGSGHAIFDSNKSGSGGVYTFSIW